MNEECCERPCVERGEEIRRLEPNSDQFLNDEIKRGINIEPLNRGYKVSVGCQNFAFETPDNLLYYLTMYLKNPAETEKKYFAKVLFK